jgi:hypothetical protein
MTLAMLRTQPSAFGTKATDDVIEAIRTGWQAQTVARISARVDACTAKFLNRRRIAININAVLEGNFEGLVSNLLKSRYADGVFAELKMEAGISQRYNVMRDVLDKCDVTISEGAEYSLTTDDEKANEALQRLMRVSHFTATLQTVSRKGWLHQATCVMPRVVWCDRLQKRVLELCVLDPSRFDLVSMDYDSGTWDVLVVYGECDASGVPRERTLWTSRGYAEQELNAKTNKWMTEEVGPNPFGVVPAVVFKPVQNCCWWHEAYGVQLAEHTIAANSAETFIDYLMSTQVKVLSGELDNMGKGQVLRPAGVINLGNAQNINMLDFNTDVAKLIDAYVERERRAGAQAVGLSGAEWSQIASDTSGVAMKIHFWSRDRGAIARRGWLVDGAKELYWLMLQVLWYELGSAQPLTFEDVREDGTVVESTEVMVLPIDGFDGGWVPGPLDAPNTFTPPKPSDVLPPFDVGVGMHDQPVKLQIDIRDVSYPLTTAEVIADDDNRLARGWAKRAEIMQERNPDLTLKEAAARVKANLTDEAQMQKIATTATRPQPLPRAAQKPTEPMPPAEPAMPMKPK